MIAELSAAKAQIVATMVGSGAILAGVIELPSVVENASGVITALNVGVGGALLTAVWVGHSVIKIAETFVQEQGKKLIELPSAEEWGATHKTLTEKLEAFSKETHLERKEWIEFRVLVLQQLSDHRARLRSLEGGPMDSDWNGSIDRRRGK